MDLRLFCGQLCRKDILRIPVQKVRDSGSVDTHSGTWIFSDLQKWPVEFIVLVLTFLSLHRFEHDLQHKVEESFGELCFGAFANREVVAGSNRKLPCFHIKAESPGNHNDLQLIEYRSWGLGCPRFKKRRLVWFKENSKFDKNDEYGVFVLVNWDTCGHFSMHVYCQKSGRQIFRI